ncbi:MAG: uracil-DNA glycosylase [Planctomycetes bacterium]|nr:uracil-DNA glycosylase [Planctomycetota bacterium]
MEVNRLFGWQVPLRGIRLAAAASRPAAPAGKRIARRPAPAPPPPALPAPLPEGERARRLALLAALDREVRACRSCPLCQGRTQTVFGAGDPCARLMFIGEGPGFDEDRLGEPFVGKAGQLLDRMIQAMGLSRREVYIANVVKCRPPDNRVPFPVEMIACMPYLRRQIEIIRPLVLCALGSTAAKALLQTTESISRLRGRFFDYQGIPLLPTFHPSYLLRNEPDKRLAWEDLQKLMRLLGLPLAPGRR